MPSNEPTQSAGTAPTAGPFTITSDAFAEGGAIPVENTCDGANTSPALAWSDAPSGTASFALIVDDPDAGGFVHWVVFDVGGGTAALPADVPLPAAGGPPQGTNSFGKVGYGGPCPPSGTHHYRFRLLALSARLSLTGAPKASAVLAAATGHIRGETILTGTYRRH
jgi:Raf kinase inhibitor-like YbhB/YbcL family protein